MALFTTPTLQVSTASILGDNGIATDMTVTYPNVNQAFTNLIFDGAPVQFNGDGRRSDGGTADDNYNNGGPAVEISFVDGVEDVVFRITDIDARTGSWDDQIRVIATDANGNSVEISVSVNDVDIVIESDGSAADGFVAQVDGSNLSNNGDATFTIAGPVTNIQIFYEDGNDFSNDNGAIGFEMVSFGNVIVVPPCFCRGTLIETKTGRRAVEDLREGDLVLTRGNGYMPLRWVMSSLVDGLGACAPIKIAAGALGNDTELKVSPQHKMLINDWRSELFLGVDEALVSAKSLVNGDTIAPEPVDKVEYFHIMFDSHQVVLSNNCWSESFYPAKQSLLALDTAAREELFDKFPDIVADFAAYGPLTATETKAYEGGLIAQH